MARWRSPLGADEPRRFIVCADQRSGSGLLCDLLARTEVAGFRETHEVLHPDRVRPQDIDWEREDLTAFMAARFADNATDNGASGIKILSGQLRRLLAALGRSRRYRDMTFGQWITHLPPHTRFVWLLRQDKLRQAISLVRAEHTQTWHIRGDQPAPRDAPPYDGRRIARLVFDLKARDAWWRDAFEGAGCAPLLVTYDRLREGREAAVKAVLRHAEIEAPAGLRISSEMKPLRDDLTERWVRRHQARSVSDRVLQSQVRWRLTGALEGSTPGRRALDGLYRLHRRGRRGGA